jgi:uncharacterized Fe-S cluster-containing MiaB family protein
LQEKLKGVPGVKKYFKIKYSDNVHNCVICGYPVSSMLTTHHINGKKDGNHIVKLCNNCHMAIHTFTNRGYLDGAFIDYISTISGAQEKFMDYIKKFNKVEEIVDS